MRKLVSVFLLVGLWEASGTSALVAQSVPADSIRYAPDLTPLVGASRSALSPVVERWRSDREALLRRFAVESSPARREALRAFTAEWRARLAALSFDSLNQDARVDYVLLRNALDREAAEVAREGRRQAELERVLPFAGTIYDLEESRRRLESMQPAAVARTVSALAERVREARRAVEASLQQPAAPVAGQGRGAGARPPAERAGEPPSRLAAFRAAAVVADLRGVLERWFRFYDGYDPVFSWWVRAPYQRADSALRSYGQLLRERVVGVRPGEEEPIVGLPLGRQALLEDLVFEMIPYTPEELVVIAEREFAWCEAEMRRAAREMGLGDDWRAALERVKNAYVEPGRQPELVRDLAREAEAYLEQHGLVTVPLLARQVWRMEMMSPERQREAPFFLGGEIIRVSFPTETMSEEDKLMSMRGNNVHFARATVHHELIPGHHLQGFMTERYQPHRRAFRTPFWSEGNAFYWEMVLWDRGYQRSPEDRVGMLFWRMHRAARIVFSLGFHLGTMTPQQAIDFLIQRVGHEPANATAEVRRSFNGNYSPLYQVAYMIGALQFRALRRELVDGRRMTERQYHDAILTSGNMPVEMLRALLLNEPLTSDYRARWRFADLLGWR
jgi:uncharacterized protein (DUF885 family)